jgi:hypothetical protein
MFISRGAAKWLHVPPEWTLNSENLYLVRIKACTCSSMIIIFHGKGDILRHGQKKKLQFQSSSKKANFPNWTLFFLTQDTEPICCHENLDIQKGAWMSLMSSFFIDVDIWKLFLSATLNYTFSRSLLQLIIFENIQLCISHRKHYRYIF